MPLISKDLTAIANELEQAFKQATSDNVDVSPNTAIGNIIQQQSQNFFSLIDIINNLENKIDFKLASGQDLDNLALMHGIFRLLGRKTKLKVTLHFNQIGNKIPAGSNFTFNDNVNLSFTNDNNIDVNARTMTNIALTATQANGEAIASDAVGVGKGINSIDNITITDISQGIGQESDEDFKNRIQSILMNSNDDILSDPETSKIKQAVLQVDNVDYVYCEHNRAKHSIKISVDGVGYDDQDVAVAIFNSVTGGVVIDNTGTSPIHQVVNAIDRQSHDIYFFRVVTTTVPVTISVTMKNQHKLADYQIAIKDVVMNYVNNKAIASSLYVSELNNFLMNKFSDILIVDSIHFNTNEQKVTIDPGKRAKTAVGNITLKAEAST